MLTKQVSNNEFFELNFKETSRALAHLEKVAKSSPWILFPEEVAYPGLWRQDNEFVYLSDFRTPRITHHKLHEMLSQSSGIKDGWLPFLVGIEVSKKKKQLTVYGYGEYSPGSIQNITVDAQTKDIFFTIMKNKFEYFSQWADVVLMMEDRVTTLPSLSSE